MKYEKVEFDFVDLGRMETDKEYLSAAQTKILERFNEGWEIKSSTPISNWRAMHTAGFLMIIWILPLKSVEWGIALDGTAIKFS